MMITVGSLTFDTSSLLVKGRYGIKGLAKFATVGEVGVERVLKEKFDLEADTLRQCQRHPNIITCHAVEFESPFMYIVTELEIATYQDVVDNTYFGPSMGECRNQLYQITKGLAHIHGLGCVHRDLKPSCIRIILPVGNDQQEPVLKLADFGFSRVRDGRQDFPLRKLADCDLWFMASEVYDSKEFVWSMDIFSLGCLWMIVLSGDFSHPFGPRRFAIDRIKTKRPMNHTLNNLKNVKREEAALVFALVRSMLSFSPGMRPTALDILNHPYFAHLALAKADNLVTLTSQQEDNGISPSADTSGEPMGSTSYLLDQNLTLVESSGNFESSNTETDCDSSRVVQEKHVQPSSPSQRETFVPYSDLNQLIRQPEKSPVPNSTSSFEFMEAIESNVEQSSVLSEEDGPCSELDDLNPSPADTDNGNDDDGCPSLLTPLISSPLPSPRLCLTSDSESDFAPKDRSIKSSVLRIPPKPSNLTSAPPPYDKSFEPLFLTNPESDHSRDSSLCMEVEADMSNEAQGTGSFYVLMDEPSTSNGNGVQNDGNCFLFEWSSVETTAPPESLSPMEERVPEMQEVGSSLATSPGKSAVKTGKAIRQKAPPKMKAPKATKSRRSANNKKPPNKRMKVESSEVTEEQESMDETPSATCSQDLSQFQPPAQPDDEPSSSSQLPDSQFGEGFFMSPNLSVANEYAVKVKQQVQVGMSVTFSEGGVERISELEEGDNGVVLSIDSAGSLSDFNVKVDWQGKGICYVRYQQIKLQPTVPIEGTCDLFRNESPTSSLPPLTLIIPKDTIQNPSTSEGTPSPPPLISLRTTHTPLPVSRLPSSLSSPRETPIKNQENTTFQRSDANVRSSNDTSPPNLPMTLESPPNASKSNQSVSKSSKSKSSKKSSKEDDSSSSKSKKKLLLPKEEELLHLSSESSLREEQLTRFMELVADRELNINCAKSSSTPILLLCRNNKSESLYPCLKSILAREDVNLKLLYHDTDNALMLLSRYYSLANPLIDCIRLLTNRGFDVNQKNKDSKTALFLLSQNDFISKNFIDIARLLINEKSDFTVVRETVDELRKRSLRRDVKVLSGVIDLYRSGQGRVNNEKEYELLQLCSLFSFDANQLERFEELVKDKEVDLNCRDHHHRSPLILLCRHSKSERLAEFLSTLLRRRSVDLNLKDSDQWNALISACYYYHNQHLVEVVRLLLARGIDGKVITKRGSNALYALCCIHCGDVPNVTEVVRALLDAGVEINGEKSALIAWCVNNIRTPDFIPVVRLLVERGIDLDQKDERGKNALLLICAQFKNGSGLLELVRLLVENQIDVNSRDNGGFNVLEILNNRPIVIDSEIIHFLKSVMSTNDV